MVNCFKGSRFLTEYFSLGLTLILSQTVFAQDCWAPTVVNGNFVGFTTEGGTAAVLCKTGYGGGGAATCSGGVWTVLPGCVPKDCGATTVANGVLLGDTFYGGNAVINCNAGYEGGGTAICGSGGTWTTLPGCNAVDCGDAGVPNGNNVGDTFYDGAPFVVCNTGYTGGGGGLTCLQSGEWDIQVQCKPKSCGTPTIANGALSGDNFYTGTASVICNAGYQGGGTATCLISGMWDILPTCTAKDCGTPFIPHGSLQAGSSTKYARTATFVCDTGYTGGGAATCLDTGSWATLPTCNPVDCGSPTILHGVLTGSTVFAGSASVVCDTGYEGGGTANCLASGNWAALPSCNAIEEMENTSWSQICVQSCMWLLCLLPIFASGWIFCSLLICYGIAVSEKHIEAGVPIISHTGMEVPERGIFGQLLNIGAVLYALNIILRFLFVKTVLLKGPKSKWIYVNITGHVLGLLSAFGLSMVANFEVRYQWIPHYLGAGLCFILAAVYCWIQTILSCKIRNSCRWEKCLSIFQFIISLMVTCLLIIFIVTNALGKFRGDKNPGIGSDFEKNINLTCAITEWLLVVCILIFTWSFVPYFKRWRLKWTCHGQTVNLVTKRNSVGPQMTSL